MIQGLYETHVSVSQLERSIEFYRDILGLQLCHYEERRRVAFFWIGKPKEAMLGVWEKPAEELHKSHFAFRCDAEDILLRSEAFLTAKGQKPYNFLKDGSTQPMVFAWMPAIAIYFNDPDGNSLEFISIIAGEARPDLGVITFAEWQQQQTYPPHNSHATAI